MSVVSMLIVIFVVSMTASAFPPGVDLVNAFFINVFMTAVFSGLAWWWITRFEKSSNVCAPRRRLTLPPPVNNVPVVPSAPRRLAGFFYPSPDYVLLNLFRDRVKAIRFLYFYLLKVLLKSTLILTTSTLQTTQPPSATL